ncbi:thioredoxin-like protein [Fusarium fujikuroi]|nr:thioredoxin-like protein [Fusarium fujikuroi]
MSQNSVVTIDSKRHFDSVLKSSRIVIADFYADWSDTSNQIAPIYERFAKDVAQPNLITLVKMESRSTRSRVPILRNLGIRS